EVLVFEHYKASARFLQLWVIVGNFVYLVGESKHYKALKGLARGFAAACAKYNENWQTTPKKNKKTVPTPEIAEKTKKSEKSEK
ncbi:MAG: hypothetical protein Q8N77_05925, partial [Nanoarchaeota archaeon]|nr:hypothetical protein [Nanoarchaeota archaeon]